MTPEQIIGLLATMLAELRFQIGQIAQENAALRAQIEAPSPDTGTST